jgi:hypothetical protein
MTSKHTPKTKRTHEKQKPATSKRKKERKENPTSLSVVNNLQLAHFHFKHISGLKQFENFRFEQQMQIRHFTN